MRRIARRDRRVIDPDVDGRDAMTGHVTRSDVAPLADAPSRAGARARRSLGRDATAGVVERDARIASDERARPRNPPAFSSPRRGADEYPDTRCA